MKSLLLSLTLLALAPAAYADDTCSSPDSGLPAAWASWTTPAALTAAAKPETAPALTVGQAYTTQLQPAAQTQYIHAPSKGVMDGSYGGLMSLTVDKAGNYAVALDNKGWVDIIRDGQPVWPVSHQEGLPCTTLHKMVVFALTPGLYSVQIANAPDATVKLEIVAQ